MAEIKNDVFTYFIDKADRIIVISNGTIKEEGSHDELVQKDGIYSKLYSLQFRTGDTTYLSHELKDGDY